MDFLPIVIFWIATILSLIFSVIGIIKNKTWLVVIGAVLFLPFVYYFGGSPATRTILVMPFLHFGSAFAVYKNNKMLAWSLFSPIVLFLALILGIVLLGS